MSLLDVVLVVVVSAVTSFLVTARHQLRALLPPWRRPKPVDPEVLAEIYRSAARVAINGHKSTGTPPSPPRPPVE